MEKLRNYINAINNMVTEVFAYAESACCECKTTAEEISSPSASVDELKERVVGLTILFQLGDIIEQSFESFEVIFDELSRFERSGYKLNYDQGEKFSKLIGAISSNTFSLIGRTLVGLNQNLYSIKAALNEIGNQVEKKELKELIEKSITIIERNILQIEDAIRRPVWSMEERGLFCIEKMVSLKDLTDDDNLSGKLYKKIRVREHVEILNRLFPTDKNYSNAGSLELF